MSYETVLVLGGTGFLGKNLQEVKADWIYAGRSHFVEEGVICDHETDFLDYNSVFDLINGINPDAVINLAADVGGIEYNEKNQLSIYENNMLINTNIIKACRELEIDRVLSCLSTCAWPSSTEWFYPTREYHFWSISLTGMMGDAYSVVHPYEGHLGYGWSKRMLHLHSQLAREAGYNYSTFAPSNLYGPHDHMDSKDSHFVAALVHKIRYEMDDNVLMLLGDGTPKRQFLYAPDLAKIIPELLEKHNSDLPLIVSPDECLSINDMAEKALKAVNKKAVVMYSGKSNGQKRKEHSNDKLKELLGDIEFTTFRDGFKKTYEWYLENK